MNVYAKHKTLSPYCLVMVCDKDFIIQHLKILLNLENKLAKMLF